MFSQDTYTNTSPSATQTTSASTNEMIGMDEEFPEFHNRVRFDCETKKGSVIDVIHVMTGQARNCCNVILLRLNDTHPELVQRFEKIRIEKKVCVSLIF